MTSISYPNSVASRAGGAESGSVHRFAGWGAVAAGACYLLQPLLVVLLWGEEEWSSPATIEAAVWRGPLEGAVFAGVGLGLLVAVIGLDRLVRRRVEAPGWRVAHVLGVVSSVGWLLMAGLSVGGSSSVARAMGDIGADLPTMQAALHMGAVMVAGVLAMVATAMAGWLLGLARWGRRAGVIGRPTAVVALVAAVACLVPQLIWSQPFGVLATIPALFVLGVALLRRAR